MTLDDAATGTVLAGRYRLEHRVRSQTHGSLWRAVDEILDREVSVRLIGIGSEYAEAVTEAARRASLGGDARLQRVLDVGTDSGYVFVVCEHVDGLDLAAATSEHPLSHEAARRVIGEAALALESAASRGIHHLRLTPSAVMVRTDGDVKVLGVAMESAASGVTAPDAEAASRSDAVGLIGLLYTALTGRWPMGDAGFAPAPWVDGSPAAPSTLVPGVPPELDQLCKDTLGLHAGPRTAGDVAAALRPWEAQRPLAALLGSAAEPEPGFAIPEQDAPAGGTRIDLVAAGETDAQEAARVTPVAGIRTVSPPAGVPLEAAPAKAKAKVPKPARTPKAPKPARQRPAPAARSGSGRHNPTTASLPLPRGWEEMTGPQRVVPSSPYPLAMPTEAPPRSQSRLVIALLAAVLVLGLLLGFSSLRGGFSSNGFFGSDPTFSPSTGSTPSVTAAPAAAAPSVVGVSALDPEGDDEENDAKAPLAIDGKSGTSWRSDQYRSAGFGNLKDGVGLSLDLGKPSTVKQVVLATSGSGGVVELRTSADGKQSGSKVVATASIDGSDVTLRPTAPVTASHLVLWFTTLPRSGGQYVADVAEIRVS